MRYGYGEYYDHSLAHDVNHTTSYEVYSIENILVTFI